MTLSSTSWTHGWTYFKESTKEGIPHRFHASNKIGFESVTGKHQKCKTAIQAYLILLCFALWSFIDFTFFRKRRQDLPPAKRSPPALLWYSFHGAGLELNLQHLRGLPVYGCHSHQRNYHPCTEPDKTTREVWSWVYLGDKHMNREEWRKAISAFHVKLENRNFKNWEIGKFPDKTEGEPFLRLHVVTQKHNFYYKPRSNSQGAQIF